MTKAQDSSLTAMIRDEASGPVVSAPDVPRWLDRTAIVLGALAAIVIAVACLIPVEVPQGPGNGIDKLYHFVAYLGLVLLLIATDPRRWVWVVPAAILFGGAIELIQPHFGRSAELLDFGANVTGVLTGWALGEALHPRLAGQFGRAAVSGPVNDGGPVEPAGEDTEPDPTDAATASRREALMAELRQTLRAELGNPVRPRRPRLPVDASALASRPLTAMQRSGAPGLH